MKKSGNKKLMTVAMLSVTAILHAGLTGCDRFRSADSLVSEARQYQEKGDSKAAIIQLKNALQKKSDNAEARYLLGSIYLQTDDAVSAEKELRKALEAGMPRDKVAPSLARALLMQGKFQKLLDETKDVHADVVLQSLQGNAYLALGKNAEARQSFENVLKISPDLPEALIGLAKYHLGGGDMENAARLSEQAVAKNPKDMESWRFRGDMLRAQGKIEQALAAYDEGLKIKPDDANLHVVKAHTQIGRGKFAEAKAELDAARKSSPGNLGTAYMQALLDFSQRNNAAALESLQQVLRVAPEHLPSLLLAGAVHYALGSNEQAEQSLKKYLDKNPDNAYARKLLASAQLKDGQAQRAAATLAPILRKDTQDVQLLVLAGEIFIRQHDFTSATEYFEKAAALAPKAATVHTGLALAKFSRGDDDVGVTELERAFSLDPKSSQAGLLLVMAHLKQKEFDKALAAVKVLEREQPDNPLVQNVKGGAYLAKQDVANARASFEKAVSLQPTYFPAVANLARLDLQAKNPEAARKRFETLLEKDKKNMQAQLALAELARSRGQSEEARTWLERASNDHPDAIEPARMLAAYYLQEGDKQKALAYAKQAQSSNPGKSDFVELLAQTEYAGGDIASALDSYGKLAVLLPDSPQVQFRIASLHMAMKNSSAAIDALRNALRIDPDFADAQAGLANIEVQKGNYGEALAIARAMQKRNAKSPAGYTLEGDVQMAQKNPALAVKAYEQAAAIAKDGSLMIRTHAALTQAGRGKEGDSRLAQWIQDHPSDTQARSYLAQMNLLAGKNKEAIEHLQVLLQENPRNAATLNNLAWAYSQQKDPQAIEYAEKAYQIAADNPAILDTLGWILIEQGKLERGLSLLRKASSLEPGSGDIRYHYAVGLFKSGDKAGARKELDQVLSAGKPFSKMNEAKALLKDL